MGQALFVMDVQLRCLREAVHSLEERSYATLALCSAVTHLAWTRIPLLLSDDPAVFVLSRLPCHFHSIVTL